MKRFFIKFWWAFPILLTVSPLMLMLSTSFFYHLDWCAKVPMLILYVSVFLLTLILLIVSWVVLLKNNQWWKFLVSLITSILIICVLWIMGCSFCVIDYPKNLKKSSAIQNNSVSLSSVSLRELNNQEITLL
jgi:hypothetical protein